jgi:hypothetical protein
VTLHPVRVVDQVLEEYRSFLLTEFRARDPKLRAALEEAIAEPRFLAQDTFYQAHRPFVTGAPWRELGLDAKLAAVMEKRSGLKAGYLHQSDAIVELLSPSARPVVVTTGTGSGKTECFLLPVIQNAIEDVVRFQRSGVTAILVYPMNALANDQEQRIREYLEASGHTSVQVERYDRTTPMEKREAMRRHPPHLLLTNYMMLEYLLVRPSDRDALFANHRCRFVVLDEVHTYRGSLGTNIALLFRRLRAHLQDAEQSWQADNRADAKRFPQLVPVGTSATIKSIDEAGRSAAEVRQLRDEAVQGFVGRLVGISPPTTIRVIGEEREPLTVPPGLKWAPQPVLVEQAGAVAANEAGPLLARLAGLPKSTSTDKAVESCGILWKLHELLAKKPLAIDEIAQTIIDTVAERKGAPLEAVRREVETAIASAAALPDATPGGLRLRAHRFIRGGWRFERCVNPGCGRLYGAAQEHCECGCITAPLYLCRSCGAHTLRFSGAEDPSAAPLARNTSRENDSEWMLYDMEALQFDPEDDDYALGGETGRKMKSRPVVAGSFDPATCSFSTDRSTYGVSAVLAPARNNCLVCGATAGAGSILTPVALGTSAAVRVVSEGLVEALASEHRGDKTHDGKERLLIFADSRQDAAHQARFITYAGRYDRMRRRLVRVLEAAKGQLSFTDAVQRLMAFGVREHDNPHTQSYTPDKFLPPTVRDQAMAWEEAPLLDDVSVSANYRATVFNLGLVGVRYAGLDGWVRSDEGKALANSLGISPVQLLHLCRTLLDGMRLRKAFSRPLLQYHPDSPEFPAAAKFADWERRIKVPNGFACTPSGAPVGSLDQAAVEDGIRPNNIWRRPKAGGRGPSLERKFKQMMGRFGAHDDFREEHLTKLLAALMPSWVTAAKLHGYRKASTLLQVNADAVELVLLGPAERFRCSVCNVKMPWSPPGAPCPACHGTLEPWPVAEFESSRYVQRIRKGDLLPLVAGEHTAQLTGDARIELEEQFKAPPSKSPVNVLACSPTLEMGIDVGGLDAVVMRNVPPRPDNYAQRGGRAGRRTRVGVVLSYARATPHDAYFFDKPAEMIAGEVPAPSLSLGNRDVILRHLAAIAFGLSEPGLKGRMVEYVKFEGELDQGAVDELIGAVKSRLPAAAEVAWRAWGKEVLAPAGFSTKDDLETALAALPARIQDVFERVRLQVLQLQKTIEQWSQTGGLSNRTATAAMDLKRALLGLPPGGQKGAVQEADDRSGGHPMRRFAEFGILPGYEFPTEPATLRLLGDRHEEETISVERRFGISQYEPDATAHARGHRWRVAGLDLSSPWNPKALEPTWRYSCCEQCGMRFGAQEHVQCPRCKHAVGVANALPGFEFGGYLAVRNDTPVLEEEDRFARANRVRIYPQRNGQDVGRFELPTGWRAHLARGEEVRWVNESKPPTETEVKRGVPMLHEDGRGFYLCPECGRILTWVDEANGTKGKTKAKSKSDNDPYGHATDCARRGKAPEPLAIVAKSLGTLLRIEVDLPYDFDEARYLTWGNTLGYSLRTGMRHLYMLDGPEVEFTLESIWKANDVHGKRQCGSLTFIDSAIGGSGFLDRAIEELHLVAARALEHLDHRGCESSCYRCLRSYNNQRFHEHLRWPEALSELEVLASAAPTRLQPAAGDDHDPKPWLEAYDAGVGSPLELKFLRLFEKHGLQVEKQYPLGPNPGEPPISTADFAIPDKKVAIYIDGAAFHVGNRLRRDRIIRNRLRDGSNGWKVVEFVAKDLANPGKILERL